MDGLWLTMAETMGSVICAPLVICGDSTMAFALGSLRKKASTNSGLSAQTILWRIVKRSSWACEDIGPAAQIPIGRITRVDSSLKQPVGDELSGVSLLDPLPRPSCQSLSNQQHVALDARWWCGLRARESVTGAIQAIRSGSWAAAGADIIPTHVSSLDLNSS